MRHNSQQAGPRTPPAIAPTQPGDVLTFEAWHPTNEEWCFCSLHRRRGLVPVSYIEVLDEVEAAAHQATQSFYPTEDPAQMLMHQDDLAVFSNMAHATSTAASTEQQQREGEGDEEDGAEAVPAMGIDATDGEAEV